VERTATCLPALHGFSLAGWLLSWAELEPFIVCGTPHCFSGARLLWHAGEALALCSGRSTSWALRHSLGDGGRQENDRSNKGCGREWPQSHHSVPPAIGRLLEALEGCRLLICPWLCEE